MKTLLEIQKKLKAPKSQYNSYGHYNYRNAEDIIEALKPIIHPMGYVLLLEDELIIAEGRYYIRATATITNGEESFSAKAYAREDESRKGMDGSQITGASSSYARKYALNGLLAIDDSKDADDLEPVNHKPKLKKGSKEWKAAQDYLSKGGKIESILIKYELSKEEQDELKQDAL